MSLRYLSGNKLSSRRLNNFNATVTYPGAAADLNYGQTTTLLHGTGTNGGQNNTFLDGSSNAFTVTRNGNSTQGTFSPFSQPDGYWSNYFGGSQSINASASTDFQFTGDFTIEAWLYPTNTGDKSLMLQNSGSNYLALNVNAGTGFNIYLNSSSPSISPTDIIPQVNQWNHIALVRSGSTVKIYLNGVASVTTATNSSTLGYNAAFYVGALGTQSTGSMIGYISNARVVNGTAVYTSNFTPSITPLTAITNTKLLTCQSNRFKDNSTGAKTMTVNDAPSVQLFSPFGGTTAYSASVNGGSGYFDGSGDYLSVASNSAFTIGTNNFTIECWIYMNDVTTTQGIYDGRTSSGENAARPVFYILSGNLYFYANAANLISAAIPKYTWLHVALVKNSGTTTMYVNGVSQGTYSDSNNYLSASSGVIIAGLINPYYFNGYMSDFRFVNGTAVYTGAFTPPTAPLTAITNTKLLLNYTNAAVLDSTGRNNFETITNASISTTQNKFGGSSIYFDGSSYLKSSTDYTCISGTEDFTVEFWVYPTSFSSYGQVLSSSSSSGLGIAINTDGTIYYTKVSVTVLGTSTNKVSLNTWNHVAVVRCNGTIKIFVNGNIGYSATDTTSFTFAAMRIGLDLNGGSPLSGYLDEFRITKGLARYLYNFTVPTAAYYDNGYSTLPTDPTTDSYFGQTPLLLHGEGSSAGQNNTFLDSSSNAFTVTRNGNTTQGTFSPFSRAEGYWSNYFSGTSSSMTVPAGSAFAPGTGDFTIEAWVYPTTFSGQTDFTIYTQTVSGTNYFLFGYSSVGALYLTMTSSGGGTGIYGGAPVAVNQWNHVAAVRVSGTVTVYVNGKGGTPTTNTMNLTDTSYVPTIGNYTHTTSLPFIGYISNLRYVKGTAVYTSNFTPSTTPLTAISGTSLLTCQSNRFKDNSSGALTVSAGSGDSVQPLSPFEPTTAYSAATNGGSAYFDGTGDYLSSSVSAIGTGDFTVEFFANLSSTYGGYFQISTTSGGLATSYANGLLAYSNSGTLWFFVGTSPYATTYTITTGEWVHIALVRSSGTVKVYVNGVLSSTPVTDTTNISGTYVALPGYYSTGYLGTGYISNFRVLVGTALYTSNFTPPTSALTAITNTKLLLSGTNASIIDSAASNVLETVSNAQASAIQYKYGTGSMYFNGSSYLNMPGSPNFVMKGDYTIECWIYNTGTTATIFDQWIGSTSGQGNYQFYINSSYKFDFYYDGLSVITHPTVMSTNTWYHLAAVRLGSTIRTYVNGLSGPTASSSAVLGRSDYTLWIGAQHQGGPSNYFTGYVDDARMTNGICRYPYNFTIPTSAYPNN